jgi:hypothetical protein
VLLLGSKKVEVWVDERERERERMCPRHLRKMKA